MLAAKIAFTDATVLVQTRDTTGITREKNNARDALVLQIRRIAGAVSTYGYMTGNADLQQRASYNPSDLDRMPDSRIDDEGTATLELARALPPTSPDGGTTPGAADYGITAPRLDLLEQQIETYNLLLGSPRQSRGEKSAATANVETTLDEIDGLLEKGMVKLIEQFEGTGFYLEYRNARKIDDPASTPAPAPDPAE